jgi:diadenosine tetraphosphate (Ap4A) HIT family hydrolase
VSAGELDQAGLVRLWAGWKRAAHGSSFGSDGLPHADLGRLPGKSLFETIEQSGLPDEQTYVVWRGPRTFVILNVFPYTNGHLMILPLRACPHLDDLDDDTYAELWRTVRDASRAVKTALGPQGLNVGVNEGMAGGGSEPDHLHVHVVPRWSADTNFMTAIAEVRVLPQTLGDTWRQLRQAWPASVGS